MSFTIFPMIGLFLVAITWIVMNSDNISKEAKQRYLKGAMAICIVMLIGATWFMIEDYKDYKRQKQWYEEQGKFIEEAMKQRLELDKQYHDFKGGSMLLNSSIT